MKFTKIKKLFLDLLKYQIKLLSYKDLLEVETSSKLPLKFKNLPNLLEILLMKDPLKPDLMILFPTKMNSTEEQEPKLLFFLDSLRPEPTLLPLKIDNKLKTSLNKLPNTLNNSLRSKNSEMLKLLLLKLEMMNKIFLLPLMDLAFLWRLKLKTLILTDPKWPTAKKLFNPCWMTLALKNGKIIWLKLTLLLKKKTWMPKLDGLLKLLLNTLNLILNLK